MSLRGRNILDHALSLKVDGKYEASLSKLRSALKIFEKQSYEYDITLYEIGLLNIQLGYFQEGDEHLQKLGFRFRL